MMGGGPGAMMGGPQAGQTLIANNSEFKLTANFQYAGVLGFWGAEVCIRAAAVEGPGVFNVGTDRFGTMHQTLTDLCEHAGTGSTVRSVPALPAGIAMALSAQLGLTPFAPYHWMMYSKSMWFDLQHLEDQLGWTPTWSTADMFAQSYDWFVANREHADDDSASHHRRSARQGALRLLKISSSLLPPAR